MELEAKQEINQTEIGIIPNDWELKRLDELGANGRPIIKAGPFGSSLKKEFYTSKGYKIYGQEQVIKNDPFFGDYFVSKAKFRELKSCEVIPGDILLSLVGTFGKILIIPENAQKGIINPRLLRISIDKLKFDVSYISYFLRSKKAKDLLESKLQGGTMGVLNAGLLKPLPIPLPPTLAEQKAIATALSDVDDLISSLDALIAKKKAIKQGAMQQLLTPDDSWQTKTIKDLATYRRGSFPQPYGLSKWYDDINGMPFVQVVDVDKNNKLKPETKQKISLEGSKKSVFVEKGTIILTIQGSIGRICITQYDAYVDRTLLIFESISSDISKYFFMLSVWLKFQIEKENAPGGIIKTITKEALSKFEITYPEINEQNRIAQILSDLDKELEELATKKEKYEHIKQGMMQELLTGKTRLV